MRDTPAQPKDYAPDPQDFDSEEAFHQAEREFESRSARPRKPRRRRGALGWYGLPSRGDAAQHLRMIRLHFLSLVGWRA